MITDTAAVRTGAAPSGQEAVRRVSWGAIFAGTVVAMALMILFAMLGVAIGAAAIDPLEPGGASGFGWGSGLYMLVTQILCLIAGGYTASRLAGLPRMTASVLHGASVWAVTTILLTWAAIAGAGALFNAASSVLSATARGAGNLAQAVVPEDVSFPDLPSLVNQISIEDLPDPVQTALEENDLTVDDLRRETRAVLSQVISEEERQEAIDLMRSTLSDALRTPGDIGEDLNAAIDRLVSGPDAIFSERDRQEAVNVLQQRLGLEPGEVEQIVETIVTRMQEAIAGLRQSIDELQQQAVQAADAAASAISSTAWWLVFASLLGLAAAVGGAVLGKPDGFLGDRLDDRS